MGEWVYYVVPSRGSEMLAAPTDAENEAIGAHFAYLRGLVARGVVRVAGPSTDPPHTGIVLFTAADRPAAEAIMQADPAVAAGVFTARLSPMVLSLASAAPVPCHYPVAPLPPDDGALWVFFYGSYMNRAVLSEVGLAPGRWELARLDGYRLTIAPLADLVADADARAYGVLATLRAEELATLYAHARDELGGVYTPRAVEVTTLDGSRRSALTYVSGSLSGEQASRDYVGRIFEPALSYAFPESYLSEIAAFLPPAEDDEA